MSLHGIKSALIIGAAPEHDVSYISALAEQKKADIVICADGGVNVAAKIGITPDIIIGDRDSAQWNEQDFPSAEKIILPERKDDTDLRVCADKAVAKGARNIYLACVSGGRADHHLANIHLLEYIHDRGASGEIYDANNIIGFHGGGKITFHRKKEYKYFSIIPADLVITNITLEGFKYPLKNGFAERSTPLTISNEPICDTMRVSFDGRAFYVFSKD